MFENYRPLVKIIQHDREGTEKHEERQEVYGSEIKSEELEVALKAFPELKSHLAGKVDYFEVAEAMPVVSQKEGRHGVSSRPERAPRVVRVVTADPSLNAETAEAIIKRRRIGDVAVEFIISAFPA